MRIIKIIIRRQNYFGETIFRSRNESHEWHARCGFRVNITVYGYNIIITYLFRVYTSRLKNVTQWVNIAFSLHL